jgi:hypothetical protein
MTRHRIQTDQRGERGERLGLAETTFNCVPDSLALLSGLRLDSQRLQDPVLFGLSLDPRFAYDENSLGETEVIDQTSDLWARLTTGLSKH